MATLLVTVTPLSEHDIEDAGRVLGAAFASSPLERAVRGPIGDRQRRGLIRAYTATLGLPGRVDIQLADDWSQSCENGLTLLTGRPDGKESWGSTGNRGSASSRSTFQPATPSRS